MCAVETIVLVTDVPMLAPITIGMACLQVEVERVIPPGQHFEHRGVDRAFYHRVLGSTPNEW